MLRVYIPALAGLMAVALFAGCSESGYVPQEGDLLFVVGGTSDFSEAITDATAWKDSVGFAHVAIVALDEDGLPYVIEATSDRGVTLTEWDAFLSSAPGVVVKRVNIDFRASEAIARAKEHLGEPYDWSYRPDNGKMYCSELVYESYLDSYGAPLFQAQPMNFRDPQGNMPAFWTDLFERLGEPIPEGLPGTNPNDLSKSPILTEVHRFF